ncbi:uncharacterized protein TNCV_2399531 [Trichonephila clavipes]|uniref:Uncharacterized protein n=1 Tax=Trichonephila clavipes TaxID=2585209 RepID=A0A8X6SW21_TRICX|nr:uncharacterized protein TNCV_2399531 [Trichonephila clavipes]
MQLCSSLLHSPVSMISCPGKTCSSIASIEQWFSRRSMAPETHKVKRALHSEDKKTLRPGFIYKSMVSAQNWTRLLRKKEYSIRKWGSDVERVAVALYLSNNTIFTSNDTMRDEIAYELSLSLLSRLALKRVEDISSTELASYVNAFLVSCIDPRKFYVLDLVSELRKRTDAQNYTNPSVMLALCNAGEKITAQDVEKLTDVFWTAHRQFWTAKNASQVAEILNGVYGADTVTAN